MLFDEFSLGILAILASIIVLTGWLPQIVKGYKTKKLDDISSYLMILIASGGVLWLVYGFEINDLYIIGVNVGIIILTMITLGLKIKYKKNIAKLT
ncbi:MAG: SemiSWEET family transporter [Nitrosopumilaceae archaeon]